MTIIINSLTINENEISIGYENKKEKFSVSKPLGIYSAIEGIDNINNIIDSKSLTKSHYVSVFSLYIYDVRPSINWYYGGNHEQTL